MRMETAFPWYFQLFLFMEKNRSATSLKKVGSVLHGNHYWGKVVEKTSGEGLIELRKGMKVTRKVEESEANVALHVYVKGQLSGVSSVPVMTCPLLDRAPKDAHLLLVRV